VREREAHPERPRGERGCETCDRDPPTGHRLRHPSRSGEFTHPEVIDRPALALNSSFAGTRTRRARGTAAATDVAGVEVALDTRCDDGAGGREVLRDAERAGEVVAAAAGQDCQQRAGMLAQRPGHAAGEPVAAERHGDLAGVRGGGRERTRMLEVARDLGVKAQAQRAQRGLDARQARAARPPPAAGLQSRAR
jgi:hypothetical protein